ncbi:hypothetical protein [Deinococcus multiflagellatus]|uniref:Uncharacterized protein n=1 Tax=Deinococcus multiflagellatus TaxID=1656887 RepID=A0ABW1ZTS9_9DEIO|nr:hypothetical protein [Deinococcus multiflagellatus]MBZ9714507.1 hypothetical protein [Deinococcus multiflagellatus]
MTGLPPSWAGVLDGLGVAPLPVGEPPPVDLITLEAALQAGVRVPRGWEALRAQATRTPVPETARQWQRTVTYALQIGRKARVQLRWAAKDRPEGDLLWAWAALPRVVEVPGQDERWAVLVSAFQDTPRLDLQTVQLRPGCWALYRGEPPYTFRHAALPFGAFAGPAQTAAHLGLDPALLAAVWPATGVRPLRNGWYVSALPGWSSGHWLQALIAALQDAGVKAWDETLLFRAYRALPGVPDVQDHTLRLALRRSHHVVRGPQPGLWLAVANEPAAPQAS